TAQSLRRRNRCYFLAASPRQSSTVPKEGGHTDSCVYPRGLSREPRSALLCLPPRPYRLSLRLSNSHHFVLHPGRQRTRGFRTGVVLQSADATRSNQLQRER